MKVPPLSRQAPNGAVFDADPVYYRPYGDRPMKRIVPIALAIFVLTAGAAFAASPDAVTHAVRAFCDWCAGGCAGMGR